MIFVPDTHALVWYVTADQRLGTNARDALASVDTGENQAVVSVLALGEILYLEEKKKIKVRLKELVENLKRNTNYLIAPLTLEIVIESENVKNVPELFDRMMASTALIYGGILLSRDSVFQKSLKLKTLW